MQQCAIKIIYFHFQLSANSVELQAVKLELETRPTYNQYQEKIKQKDDLQEQLTTSDLMISSLQFKVSTMEEQLAELKKLPPKQCDAMQQTETEIVNDLCEMKSITPNANSVSHSQSNSIEFDHLEQLNLSDQQNSSSSSSTCLATSSSSSASSSMSPMTNSNVEVIVDDHIQQIIDSDMPMMIDPNVQREEELILFKEKCAQLTDDLLRAKAQMDQLKSNGSQYSTTTMFMMMAPIVALVSYLLISPYF